MFVLWVRLQERADQGHSERLKKLSGGGDSCAIAE